MADRQLQPLEFHEALARTLEKREPGLWSWFASDDFGAKYAANVRLELLRSTYRLPPASHQKFYALATEAARALDVEVPLTLYQAQGEGGLNAGLVFVPGEAHVVLRGPIEETLNEAELKALFGHELAHHRLWTEQRGRFRVAEALIEHVAGQQCAPSHVQSALRQRRWTELYADRGSLLACDDLHTTVRCLVKMTTGLRDVEAAAYLAQAEEALAVTASGSEGVTHPESFIRAFALKHWTHAGDEQRLRAVVDGPLELETLDVLQQEDLTQATRALLDAVLTPDWMRTEATLTHARRFFAEDPFAPPAAQLPSLPIGDQSLQEYFAYVLLDFALIDPELEDTALAYIAQLGRRLGVEALPRLARKELRMSAASWTALEEKALPGVAS